MAARCWISSREEESFMSLLLTLIFTLNLYSKVSRAAK
jgi:hypothetical protein